jgi:hypothetical protein
LLKLLKSLFRELLFSAKGDLMKLLSIFVFLLGAKSFGAVSETRSMVDQGTIEASITGGFGWGSASGFSAAVPLAGSYFLTDNLSVGGVVTFSSGGSRAIGGIGPEVTYYLLKEDNFGVYASQSLAYSQTQSYYNDEKQVREFFFSTSELGVDYFLTNSVALTPALAYRVLSDSDMTSTTLGVQLKAFFQ